jgi:uncharacterized protein YecE (DUF72 family)
MGELNREIVRKDLEKWAKKLRQIDISIHEVYDEMNNIYREAIENDD